MKSTASLSDRALSKHITGLEADLTAARLRLRTQKAAKLTRELMLARLERMKRAQRRKAA